MMSTVFTLSPFKPFLFFCIWKCKADVVTITEPPASTNSAIVYSTIEICKIIVLIRCCEPHPIVMWKCIAWNMNKDAIWCCWYTMYLLLNLEPCRNGAILSIAEYFYLVDSFWDNFKLLNWFVGMQYCYILFVTTRDLSIWPRILKAQ